jgi:hypothetical protein
MVPSSFLESLVTASIHPHIQLPGLLIAIYFSF